MGSVLVADDDPLVRLVLRTVLERRGLRVVEAADGGQLLDSAAVGAFDLCLMDVSMPGPDLEERLALLRDRSPNLQVVVMTGFLEDPCPAARRGVTVLRKPLDLVTLESVLTAGGVQAQ